MADEQTHYSSPFINQYVKVPMRVSGKVEADHRAEYEGVRHCVGVIAVNLLASGKVAYSRNNHFYTENHTGHYTYANMMRAVQVALEGGYAVELQKGYWDRSFEKGLSSTLGAGPRLNGLGQPAEMELDTGSLPLLAIDKRQVFSGEGFAAVMNRLRTGNAESLPLLPRLDGIYADALRLNRDYWNRMTVGTGGLAAGTVCMGQVGLTRLFKEGGVGRWFQRGGLSYQELSKRDRARLTLGGEPVAELDYPAMHPHILYAWEKERCPDDFYDRVTALCGCSREVAKRMTLAAVNAESYKKLSSGVNFTKTEGPGNLYDGLKSVGLTPIMVVEALVEAHPILEMYVFSGQANRLMLAESDIMTAILLKLMGLGIPALPVHDSVVAPARHRATVRRLMEGEYRRQMGFDIEVG